MARRILILVLLAVLTASAPVCAQDLPAPYDANLQRLAEILGSLHYLRGICGANEGQKWRNQMQALVDATIPTSHPGATPTPPDLMRDETVPPKRRFCARQHIGPTIAPLRS
jgi:hypothetical protein